ncbi:uncharacterized protein B0P05DRAFT_569938 [Gilbertella persicaria]|uniref:uncharacterized protein n=1 Tax=Gilbertella persicaria TaxID=101096 RepID=UPI00222067CC|nr:uncharacterized protein B0P05DRAFT_569938 [Gilbertella persicaria]KAI8087033.1 hypothetical protein B0P05DRAFT_569938 [Gilbertella persicaria]
MISLPFGRTRWISRYFVLLDSELRFYKDEHSDSPVQVLNLRQVYQVIPAPNAQHPFCFRLEPSQQGQWIKPWVIECKNEFDMKNWLAAIKNRLKKNNEDKRSHRAASTISVTDASPEMYRLPTLPLRCTNLESERTVKKEPLLSRRKQTLAPIVTDPSFLFQPQLTISPPILNQKRRRSSFLLPSSVSSASTVPSPTGAVIGPLDIPHDDMSKPVKPSLSYAQYVSSTILLDRIQQKDSYKQLVPQPSLQKGQQKECEVSLESPTFLTYKRRFRL